MLFIRRLHKYLSLVVGLQLLIWIVTGMFFNLMSPAKASGNQNRQRPTPVIIDNTKLIEPRLILAKSSSTVSLKQILLLNKPYYLLTHYQGLYNHFKTDQSLVNAYTGAPVVIDKILATELAYSSYKGDSKINSIEKVHPPFDDIPREQNTMWRANFNDELETSVYINASSGRIIAHSNNDKRFADIFFMLHFMDYGNKGNFNNIQIITFAIFTLFLSLTGIVWTINLGLKGRYKFKRSYR